MVEDGTEIIIAPGFEGDSLEIIRARQGWGQDVRLLEVQGPNLVVEGLDAINGTPVLDIKMCWRRSE